MAGCYLIVDWWHGLNTGSGEKNQMLPPTIESMVAKRAEDLVKVDAPTASTGVSVRAVPWLKSVVWRIV
jgi:hypothetical protein